MPYATRSDMEQIFGKTNIDAWADIDKLPTTTVTEQSASSAAITARIDFFLAEADVEIDDALREGPYEVPFITVHSALTAIAARLAAYRMYTARGAVADDNELADALKYVEQKLQGYRSGSLRFPVAVTERAGAVPDVGVSS